MNRIQKFLFAVATIVALGWVGANTASAQLPPTTCDAPLFIGGTVVRAEGTTEQVSNVIIQCDNAAVAGVSAGSVPASVTATIQLALTPSATRFTPVAGATAGTTCNTSVADNRTTFPCPSLTSTTAFAVVPVATISNNVMTFVFTPNVGVQTFTISSVRVNVGTSGLVTGGLLLTDVFQGGGIGSKRDTSGVIASVNNVIGAASLVNQTSGLPLNITACGPQIKTPVGTPLALLNNPDPGVIPGAPPTGTAASSVPFTLLEGMSNALATLVDNIGGGNGIAPDAGALQAIRIRINFTNVPAGVAVYVPHQVSAGSAAGITGSVSGATVLTLVTGANSDGSGGSPVEIVGPANAATVNQYDLVNGVAGTVTVLYDVTQSDLVTVETVTMLFALTGTGNIGVGAIGGSISVSPNGPPSITAARPQFRAGASVTVANTVLCATYLLFPYVINTGDGAYDTGISIANTSADPASIGSTPAAGDVTLYFWSGTGTTNPAPVTFKTGLAGGNSAIDTLSNILKGAKFQGYMIAVCNFTLGHGFAFINSPSPGTGGQFAMGYIANVITNPRLGGGASPTEASGQ